MTAKIISTIAFVLFIAAFIFNLSFAANAQFGNTCKNVNFRVKNGKNVAIEIKKVKYYNASEGRWETENVKNKSEFCGIGQTCELENEDLAGDENDRLTKVIFIYEDVNSKVERESQVFEPKDSVCRADKIYGFGQGWTIGGNDSTGGSSNNAGGSSANSYKTPAANKSAVLIYFNFGENSEYTKLFQDTVKLKKAMEGYQRIVLLKSQEVPSWLDLSEADEKKADVILPPTKNNFFEQILDLTNKGYYIDIYIFSHGWNERFGPKNSDAQQILSSDITSRLAVSATGYKAIPIRMIWSSTCYGRTLSNEWTNIGAKTVAGARYVNFYPHNFGNFVNDWNKGNVSFSKAIADADTNLVRTAGQTYILADAAATNKEWGKCPFGQTVLGNNDCAKDYFTTQWIADAEWLKNKSGKENMNNSSALIVSGSGNLTKNTKPTW